MRDNLGYDIKYHQNKQNVKLLAHLFLGKLCFKDPSMSVLNHIACCSPSISSSQHNFNRVLGYVSFNFISRIYFFLYVGLHHKCFS